MHQHSIFEVFKKAKLVKIRIDITERRFLTPLFELKSYSQL